MLKPNSILIGTTQLQALASFYEAILGRPADMVSSEEGFFGWKFGDVFLAIFTHSEMAGMAKDPGRVMINYETEQVSEDYARLQTLGAVAVHAPYESGGGWLATLADPDGNYFQLLTPNMQG